MLAPTLRSAVNAARFASQRMMRSTVHPCIAVSMYSKHASSIRPMWRSFAAEAGYLDKDEVSTRVLEVVRKFEKVQPEKVTDASHFVNDLGLDSLDTVELVMALEDEFSIEISDEQAEKIMTCGDAIAYVADNIHAK